MLSVLWTVSRISCAFSSVFGGPIMTGSEFMRPPAATLSERVVRWPIESICAWFTP